MLNGIDMALISVKTINKYLPKIALILNSNKESKIVKDSIMPCLASGVGEFSLSKMPFGHNCLHIGMEISKPKSWMLQSLEMVKHIHCGWEMWELLVCPL